MAFFAWSSLVLLVPGRVAAEAPQHRLGDVTLQPAHAAAATAAAGAGEANAEADFQTVLVTTLVGGRHVGVEEFDVLFEEGVGDLFCRVPTHVLVQEMNDEKSVGLQILIDESGEGNRDKEANWNAF